MTGPFVQAVWSAHASRMLGAGVPPPELERLRSSIQSWDGWFEAWIGVGRRYEETGRFAIGQGNDATAGELLWRASVCYQYSHFLLWHHPDDWALGQRRKESAYRAAAPFIWSPAERVEVEAGGAVMAGSLRFPEAAARSRFPLVLVLGGLEGTKEEAHTLEDVLLTRGMATFSFDGPGQGETYSQLRLPSDFERYTSAVIDCLVSVDGVDASRLGIIGRSLGGYLAVRSAALDPRLKACVSWGVFYDMSFWDDLPSVMKRGFQHISGRDSEAEARAYLTSVVDLSGVAEQLNCSLYVLHGARDALIPTSHVDKLDAATRHLEDRVIDLEPEGNHCCHNLYPFVQPRVADWLAARLGAERG